MRLADIPQVLEIERESFPAMWPPTAFKRELQQNRLAHYIVVVEHNPDSGAIETPEPPPSRRPGAFGRILRTLAGADEGSRPPPGQRPELVTGFIGVWMLPDEAHIVTIAVRGGRRRRGIGELMLIRAIELAQAMGQGLVTLECRVSNEAAIRLYEKYGFQQVGVRPRYYSDNQEDALVLTVSSVLTQRYEELLIRLREAHRERWGDFEIAGD
jgi:ribosomal-protein-alanine N-acetyltransferase